MDATEAEFLKYASNALFGVKVSFANEMEELARSLGVTWEPVRQALILDPRVGDGHLTVPGPDGQRGFGGSCLPKDIAGLLSLASTVGVELPVIAAAVQANSRRRVC
jgi:UDPglucose 6-dehydrogenase